MQFKAAEISLDENKVEAEIDFSKGVEITDEAPIGKDIFSFSVIISVLWDVFLFVIKQTELRTPINFNCQSWVINYTLQASNKDYVILAPPISMLSAYIQIVSSEKDMGESR